MGMNLAAIRRQFIIRSGRYDLVRASREEMWADAGADFFIRAGQRLLDKQGDFQTGRVGTWHGSLPIRSRTVVVPLCWMVERVVARPLRAERGRWIEVPRMESREGFKKCFGTYPFSYTVRPQLDHPRVKPYQSASAQDIPASSVDQTASELEALDSTQSLVLEFLGKPGEWLTIWRDFRPRSHPHRDHALSLEVTGKFFSDPLIQDEDENFWTLRYPETLLKASLYELEVFYRNSEGAQDWFNAVKQDLLDIESMELLQDIQPKDVMVGAYDLG